MSLKLFYVRAEGEECDLDLLVRAETEDEALTGWDQYYADDGVPPPRDSILWCGEVPAPTDGPKGAIKWQDIGGT